jgi:hypothetical protein
LPNNLFFSSEWWVSFLAGLSGPIIFKAIKVSGRPLWGEKGHWLFFPRRRKKERGRKKIKEV